MDGRLRRAPEGYASRSADEANMSPNNRFLFIEKNGEGPVKRLAFSISTLLAVLSPPAQGAASQRSACAADVMRMCRAFVPHAARTTACLRSKGERLNPACRTALKNDRGPPRRRHRTGG